MASFLDFKEVCDTCNVPHGSVMCLRKRYLSGLGEYVVNARLATQTESRNVQVACLTSYFAFVNFLLNRYATSDNIAKMEARHSNILETKCNVDRLRLETTDEDSSMKFRLHQEDTQRPPWRCCKQVDISDTPPVVVRNSVGFITVWRS